MSFFNSEVVRAEMSEIAELQEEIYKNVLPDSLITISFGWYYENEINDNIFPQSLELIKYYDNNYSNKAFKNLLLMPHKFKTEKITKL